MASVPPTRFLMELPRESPYFGQADALLRRNGFSPFEESSQIQAPLIVTDEKPWESEARLLDRALNWVGFPKTEGAIDLAILDCFLSGMKSPGARTWDQSGPIGVVSLPIGSSDDKPILLNHLETLLHSKLDLPGRIGNQIITAADELILNALFDAPVEPGTGAQIHAKVARDAYVAPPPDRPCRFETGTLGGGKWIGVSATDSFGSIDRGKIARLISRDFTKSTYHVETNHEGAGIGLSSVLKKGGSLSIHCVP
ncbi:MAG: hypothetical protein AAB425_14410 [Bdellovibrionota bacterium]